MSEPIPQHTPEPIPEPALALWLLGQARRHGTVLAILRSASRLARFAALAGVIYIAYYRSFLPLAGQLRELDVIASVIIGGGSIFGGYGSVLGALAGAAVITLLRGLMALQIITSDGRSFVMPQHWVNVGIGLILIVAVLSDIWLRQQAALQRVMQHVRATLRPVREAEL